MLKIKCFFLITWPGFFSGLFKKKKRKEKKETYAVKQFKYYE